MSVKDDLFFLGLAAYTATRSKDPSTKVGACVVREDRTIASLGYNGFPRAVCDDPARLHDRPTKHAFTVHAETNAILSAGGAVRGHTLYVAPLLPCPACAGVIIQSGIRRVVACQPLERPDWGPDITKTMFREAGVQLDIYAGISLEVDLSVRLDTGAMANTEQLELQF
jgi:dCMP deaminase